MSKLEAGEEIYNPVSGDPPPLVWVLEGEVELIYIKSDAKASCRLTKQFSPRRASGGSASEGNSGKRRRATLSTTFDILKSYEQGNRLQVVRVTPQERAAGVVGGPLDTFSTFLAGKELYCVIKATAPSVCAVFRSCENSSANRMLMQYAARRQLEQKLERTWNTRASA